MYVTVYRATPGRATGSILQLLRRQGLSPRTIGAENPSAMSLYAAKGTYTLEIVVPQSEAAAARAILQALEARQAEAIRRLTMLNRRWLISVCVYAMVIFGCTILLDRQNWTENLAERLLAAGIGGLAVTISLTAVSRWRSGSTGTNVSRNWRDYVAAAAGLLVCDWGFSGDQPTVQKQVDDV